MKKCVDVVVKKFIEDGIDVMCLIIVGYGEECFKNLVNMLEVYVENCCVEVKVKVIECVKVEC